MCQKRIPDNDLDNTTGGFSGVTTCNGNAITLTQKEYDELQRVVLLLMENWRIKMYLKQVSI